MKDWIKTSEKLPEPFVPVIVARIYKKGKPLKVEQGKLGIGDWWHVYGTNIKSKNVLFWMPMSEPPEADA